MLKTGRHPGQIEVHQDRRVLEVMPLLSNARQAQDGELAGAEALLEFLELPGLELSVGDVRLDAVTFSERLGELAQAPHPVGEHEHLLL